MLSVAPAAAGVNAPAVPMDPHYALARQAYPHLRDGLTRDLWWYVITLRHRQHLSLLDIADMLNEAVHLGLNGTAASDALILAAPYL